MTLPTQVLPDHHRHCDDLFVAAENAVQRRDWALAEREFAHFRAQMDAHFVAEEETLFPAFEDATGSRGGPTEMMRYEHDQMRDLLGQLDAACKARDGKTYAGVSETLLTLMQQHNMKEEHILYPMCDRALGDRADAMGDKLSTMLEGGGA
jgi:hemerythrin-like domain-containing protein